MRRFVALLMLSAAGCVKPCAAGGTCPQQTQDGRGATTPAKPACVTYAPLLCLGGQSLVCTIDAKGCEICGCARPERRE